MCKTRRAVPAAAALLFSILACGPASTAVAQTQARPDPVSFHVDGPAERLEMIVNNSRILTLEVRIPRFLVNNPDIVQATPLSPNQLQVSARRPGVTQLNIWDENDQVHTIDIVVYADARELENLLRIEFPNAAIRVRPLANSVYLSGYVPSAGMVNSIVLMAEDYYPNVINNLTVGGVQQIMLRVKVMEVSRTKLRNAGFDWANLYGNDIVVQSVSGLIGGVAAGMAADPVAMTAATPPSAIGSGTETLRFGIVDGNNAFFGFVEALRQDNLIKVLAEPTLVTVSGRPASFNSGGEFPIIVPQSLGTVSVEYRQFGTRVDFVPIVLGNGNVRLEVRPQVSEIDPARSVSINGITVPGLRTRWVDTAVEMQAGQTLALAGLIQNRIEAERRGLPWVSELPWFGAPFRRVAEQMNEIELLIMVTPEFVDAVDPHQLPPLGPGQITTSPNDIELFWRGYLEVPRCCPDGTCPQCLGGQPHAPGPVEVLPQDLQGPGTPQLEDPAGGGEGFDPQAQGRSPGFGPVRRGTVQPASGRTPAGPQPAPRPSGEPGLIGPIGYDPIR